METKLVIFDGVPLIVPVVDSTPIELPYKNFEEFASYCGAGSGWGDKIVPEFFADGKIKVSPACFIHDTDFELADRTWQEFRRCNNNFFFNLVSIVFHKGKTVEDIRDGIAGCIRYYEAVSRFGQLFFFKSGDLAVK